jgi:hypothetical protein
MNRGTYARIGLTVTLIAAAILTLASSASAEIKIRQIHPSLGMFGASGSSFKSPAVATTP